MLDSVNEILARADQQIVLAQQQVQEAEAVANSARDKRNRLQLLPWLARIGFQVSYDVATDIVTLQTPLHFGSAIPKNLADMGRAMSAATSGD